MHVEASRRAVTVRFGTRFAVPEAEHLADAVQAFMPLSELLLDFSDVSAFEDSAIVPLARTLAALAQVKVRIHGLTTHQWRMLGYFGVRHEPLRSLRDDHVGQA